jgi:hypothetical protein
VTIVGRSRGHRRRLARVRLLPNGTFALRARVRAPRKARFVRIHAVVRGVGRSRSVRIKLRGAGQAHGKRKLHGHGHGHAHGGERKPQRHHSPRRH